MPRRIACLLLSLLLAASARAQQNPPTTLHSNSTLVLVPALVSSPGVDGALAYGLMANDFRVTDDGVPQRLTMEDTQAQPLDLVILMQTGGYARMQFAAYRHLDTMLRALADGNPCRIAVVDFDSTPHLVAPFSADLDAFPPELTQPSMNPQDDGAAIFDGVAYALDLLKQQPSTMRRAILLISQPQDNGSKTRREDMIRSISETNTAIYSLTFSPEKQTLKNAFTLKEKTHGNPPLSVGGCIDCVAYFNLSAPLGLAYQAMRSNAAREVATLSGGESFGFENKTSFEASLGTLTNDITNRYTLSFRPTSNHPGFHALQITMKDQPGLHVQARTGYWVSDGK